LETELASITQGVDRSHVSASLAVVACSLQLRHPCRRNTNLLHSVCSETDSFLSQTGYRVRY